MTCVSEWLISVAQGSEGGSVGGGGGGVGGGGK